MEHRKDRNERDRSNSSTRERSASQHSDNDPSVAFTSNNESRRTLLEEGQIISDKRGHNTDRYHDELNSIQQQIRTILQKPYRIPRSPRDRDSRDDDEISRLQDQVLLECQKDIEALRNFYHYHIHDISAILTLWVWCPWILNVLALALPCVTSLSIDNREREGDRVRYSRVNATSSSIAMDLLNALLELVDLIDEDPKGKLKGVHNCSHSYFPSRETTDFFQDSILMDRLIEIAPARRLFAMILHELFLNNDDIANNRFLQCTICYRLVVSCLLRERDEKQRRRYWIVLNYFVKTAGKDRTMSILFPNASLEISSSRSRTTSSPYSFVDDILPILVEELISIQSSVRGPSDIGISLLSRLAGYAKQLRKENNFLLICANSNASGVKEDNSPINLLVMLTRFYHAHLNPPSNRYNSCKNHLLPTLIPSKAFLRLLLDLVEACRFPMFLWSSQLHLFHICTLFIVAMDLKQHDGEIFIVLTILCEMFSTVRIESLASFEQLNIKSETLLGLVMSVFSTMTTHPLCSLFYRFFERLLYIASGWRSNRSSDRQCKETLSYSLLEKLLAVRSVKEFIAQRQDLRDQVRKIKGVEIASSSAPLSSSSQMTDTVVASTEGSQEPQRVRITRWNPVDDNHSHEYDHQTNSYEPPQVLTNVTLPETITNAVGSSKATSEALQAPINCFQQSRVQDTIRIHNLKDDTLQSILHKLQDTTSMKSNECSSSILSQILRLLKESKDKLQISLEETNMLTKQNKLLALVSRVLQLDVLNMRNEEDRTTSSSHRESQSHDVVSSAIVIVRHLLTHSNSSADDFKEFCNDHRQLLSYMIRCWMYTLRTEDTRLSVLQEFTSIFRSLISIQTRELLCDPKIGLLSCLVHTICTLKEFQPCQLTLCQFLNSLLRSDNNKRLLLNKSLDCLRLIIQRLTHSAPTNTNGNENEAMDVMSVSSEPVTDVEDTESTCVFDGNLTNHHRCDPLRLPLLQIIWSLTTLEEAHKTLLSENLSLLPTLALILRQDVTLPDTGITDVSISIVADLTPSEVVVKSILSSETSSKELTDFLQVLLKECRFSHDVMLWKIDFLRVLSNILAAMKDHHSSVGQFFVTRSFLPQDDNKQNSAGLVKRLIDGLSRHFNDGVLESTARSLFLLCRLLSNSSVVVSNATFSMLQHSLSGLSDSSRSSMPKHNLNPPHPLFQSLVLALVSSKVLFPPLFRTTRLYGLQCLGVIVDQLSHGAVEMMISWLIPSTLTPSSYSSKDIASMLIDESSPSDILPSGKRRRGRPRKKPLPSISLVLDSVLRTMVEELHAASTKDKQSDESEDECDALDIITAAINILYSITKKSQDGFIHQLQHSSVLLGRMMQCLMQSLKLLTSSVVAALSVDNELLLRVLQLMILVMPMKPAMLSTWLSTVAEVTVTRNTISLPVRVYSCILIGQSIHWDMTFTVIPVTKSSKGTKSQQQRYGLIFLELFDEIVQELVDTMIELAQGKTTGGDLTSLLNVVQELLLIRCDKPVLLANTDDDSVLYEDNEHESNQEASLILLKPKKHGSKSTHSNVVTSVAWKVMQSIRSNCIVAAIGASLSLKSKEEIKNASSFMNLLITMLQLEDIHTQSITTSNNTLTKELLQASVMKVLSEAYDTSTRDNMALMKQVLLHLRLMVNDPQARLAEFLDWLSVFCSSFDSFYSSIKSMKERQWSMFLVFTWSMIVHALYDSESPYSFAIAYSPIEQETIQSHAVITLQLLVNRSDELLNATREADRSYRNELSESIYQLLTTMVDVQMNSVDLSALEVSSSLTNQFLSSLKRLLASTATANHKYVVNSHQSEMEVDKERMIHLKESMERAIACVASSMKHVSTVMISPQRAKGEEEIVPDCVITRMIEAEEEEESPEESPTELEMTQMMNSEVVEIETQSNAFFAEEIVIASGESETEHVGYSSPPSLTPLSTAFTSLSVSSSTNISVTTPSALLPMYRTVTPLHLNSPFFSTEDVVFPKVLKSCQSWSPIAISLSPSELVSVSAFHDEKAYTPLFEPIVLTEDQMNAIDEYNIVSNTCSPNINQLTHVSNNRMGLKRPWSEISRLSPEDINLMH